MILIWKWLFWVTVSFGAEPFAFEEIVNQSQLARVQFMPAADGVNLGYRVYKAAKPKAVLLFYHGAGAHSAAGYGHFGVSLAGAGITVITPDIRGHGHSGGPRGHTPEPALLWQDIEIMSHQVTEIAGNLPVLIGGHSTGGGLVINYLSNYSRKFDGIVLISPYLGYDTDIDNDDYDGDSFTESSFFYFAMNRLSGGTFFSSAKGVTINYPEKILKDDPLLVPYQTVNLALGYIPETPEDQIKAISSPIGLWIGTKDEVFDGRKVNTLMRQLRQNPKDRVALVKGANHITILHQSYSDIVNWVSSL